MAILVLGLALLTQTGCDPRALLYFLQPFEPEIPPPCPSLKGKRVAILTHAAAGTQVDFQDLSGRISRDLASRLRKDVKKIEVIPAEKVDNWVTKNPSYTDPAQLGHDLDVDVVIFLEVEQFQVQNPLSPTMFEGASKIHVQVHELKHPLDDKGKPQEDKPKEAEIIHDDYRETAFPRVQGALPMSASVNRATFQKKFFEVVMTELSWHFVPHVSGDSIQDTDF